MISSKPIHPISRLLRCPGDERVNRGNVKPRMRELFTVVRWNGTIVGLSQSIRTDSPSLALFDRDDTLIRDSAERVLSPQDVLLLPGAIDAVREASHRGASVGVITNQSAVARGWLDVNELSCVMEELARQTMTDNEEPLPLHFWIACPHLPDAGCACRKPRPGMIRQAMALHTALERVVVFGDRASDVLAAHAAGVVGCRVEPGQLPTALRTMNL